MINKNNKLSIYRTNSHTHGETGGKIVIRHFIMFVQAIERFSISALFIKSACLCVRATLTVWTLSNESKWLFPKWGRTTKTKKFMKRVNRRQYVSHADSVLQIHYMWETCVPISFGLFVSCKNYSSLHSSRSQTSNSSKTQAGNLLGRAACSWCYQFGR